MMSKRISNVEREKYTKPVFSILAGWLIVVFVIIILQGFGLMSLSDTVIIALITKTTISIITLPIIVIKYLLSDKKY